jgi:hypothetical protein
MWPAIPMIVSKTSCGIDGCTEIPGPHLPVFVEFVAVFSSLAAFSVTLA